jgi:hypothetical protein
VPAGVDADEAGEGKEADLGPAAEGGGRRRQRRWRSDGPPRRGGAALAGPGSRIRSGGGARAYWTRRSRLRGRRRALVVTAHAQGPARAGSQEEAVVQGLKVGPRAPIIDEHIVAGLDEHCGPDPRSSRAIGGPGSAHGECAVSEWPPGPHTMVAARRGRRLWCMPQSWQAGADGAPGEALDPSNLNPPSSVAAARTDACGDPARRAAQRRRRTYEGSRRVDKPDLLRAHRLPFRGQAALEVGPGVAEAGRKRSGPGRRGRGESTS